ncbi:unnamed protein product, partial [Cladocopium goreaui]
MEFWYLRQVLCYALPAWQMVLAMPKKTRKALSHLGAVRRTYTPAAVQKGVWSSSSGLVYGAAYAVVWHKLGLSSMLHCPHSSAESLGDILEAVDVVEDATTKSRREQSNSESNKAVRQGDRDTFTYVSGHTRTCSLHCYLRMAFDLQLELPKWMRSMAQSVPVMVVKVDSGIRDPDPGTQMQVDSGIRDPDPGTQMQ